MPPDFSRVDYWTDRFHNEQHGFEWLTSTDSTFQDRIQEAIDAWDEASQPHILHIGPGSSKLSLWLRERVSRPTQVLNADFAQSAVDLGSRWEKERWPSSESYMRWETADLLKFADVEKLMTRIKPPSSPPNSEAHFGLIVDKSTTDAVSCGDDGCPNGGIVGRIKFHRPEITSEGLETRIHPELLLALNLACIVPSGSLWFCLSYNSARFRAMTDRLAGRADPSASSVEDFACSLWAVEKKIDIETGGGIEDDPTIHRPKITNWLYVLRRTKTLI